MHEFFHERRVKNTFEFRTAVECWRLCRNAVEVQFGDGRRVRFESNLGLKLGTRVFLEEIIGRYYYNAIQGLVYGGATLILISIALFLLGYSMWFALASFFLEAAFLLFLSIATAYQPPEDSVSPYALGLPENVLVSISNSVREMTNAVSDLFRLFSQTDIRQDMLLTRLTEYLSKANSENTRLFIEKLEETNALLRRQTAAAPDSDVPHPSIDLAPE